jgi:hypothetical protein
MTAGRNRLGRHDHSSARAIGPVTTSRHVNLWKTPSQIVLMRSPWTVSVG